MCDIDITIGEHKHLACSNLIFDYIDFNMEGLQKKDNKILLRNAATKEFFTTYFETWLLNSLEHEILHIVLKNHINIEASECLDNVINGKVLEWELLKERTKEGVTL
jgi:hypothetical protein